MAYLVLANGTVFEGQRFGAKKDGIGELVFTTGVVGYTETVTNPAYAGQIVIQTFPQIGNYGVNEEDFEGKALLSGYVVREFCKTPSNFRSEYEIEKLLCDKDIPGICGVDTRELTRIIREEGVMNALICDEIPSDLACLKSYSVKNPVMSAGTEEKRVIKAENEKFNVSVIDYGAVNSLVKALTSRGCSVSLWPADTKAEEILSEKPDGIVLSGGPGDPADNEACIAEIKKLLGKAPVFGIGLGHQLAGIAQGAEVFKLPFGHRGASQPVKDTGGSRTYITSQTHGYCLTKESAEKCGEISFVNANDGSVEGMSYPGINCFTVQFYPDSEASSHGTGFIYDRFMAMMGGMQDA